MNEPAALLDVQDLSTHFHTGRRWPPGAPRRTVKAIDGVSFRLHAGEVLGLVGESGCGKSTVGRTLTRLENAAAGRALLDGEDILAMSAARFRPLRRRLQMIFQDPFGSLNPRLTIEQTMAEPLRIHGIVSSRADARARIADMLERVGLGPDAMTRHPHAFSGGQRQRIGIARVMILAPSVVIADEVVSALDVSVQAQVLNLLKALQRDSGVAMLFISHDLGVVRHIGDRIAVMYLGRIVESGPTETVFDQPVHPYTQLLLTSIPRADPTRRSDRVIATGEAASAADPPSGCAFHPRCPRTTELCRRQAPPLQAFAASPAPDTAGARIAIAAATDDARRVACHHPGPAAVRAA